MFPLWLNEFLPFPVFWITCHDPYGRGGLLIAICSTTRNTGNIGNRIEASRVGLDSHVEQTWNTGNRPMEAEICAKPAEGLPRVIKIFAKRSARDHTMFLAGQKMVPTAAAARKMVIRFGHVSLSSPFFSALLRGFCGAWRRRSGVNPKSETRS